MIEIHEDDRETIRGLLVAKTVPEDVLLEYGLRMRYASIGGHSGTMGLFPIIDMLRFLDYKPRPKRMEVQPVKWKQVRLGAPVIVDSPETTTKIGRYEGDLGQGVLSIRSPYKPSTDEVYAKYVRLATEDDDISCLQDGPRMPTESMQDSSEDDYVDDIPARSSKPVSRHRDDDDDDEEEDNEHVWTRADLGREVLVEDGDAELVGTLVAVSDDGSKVTVEVNNGDSEGFSEEYPAESVYSNEQSPVMVLAAAEAAAKQAAEESETGDMI